MIGFLVRIRVRVRVRVGVTFNVRVYHWSNCRRSKCRTLHSCRHMQIVLVLVFSDKPTTYTRLVSRTKKYQSISPVLQSLHWLPVHYRIMFKILLLSYQCFHNLAPSYLTELLTIYKPGRNLRSGKKNFFVISPVLTKTYGERTFAHAAPIMWNNLPDSLRSLNSMEHFKSALKT